MGAAVKNEGVPLVTVVMPAYNAETTIGASLSGVLTQTHPSVEVVVVDDGSTDRTGDICQAHGDAVRYLRQENAGSSVARNAALEQARGDFIAFCDADDVLLPAYLEKALARYHDAGGGRRVVMCEALQLTSTGLAHGRRLIGPHFPQDRQRLAILQKNFVPILSLFPRQLLDEVPGFAEDLLYCEDWEFWIRTVLSGWEVVFQPEPHALYRLTPDAKSADERRHAAEDVIVRRVKDEHWDGLGRHEREFLTLRLGTEAPRLLDLRAGEDLRARRWSQARGRYRSLAGLSSQDRRVQLRSLVFGYVPGALRIGRWRQLLIDRRTGGRIAATVPDKSRSTPSQERN
ncbi:glycosyltransferase family 2 protein [Ornithinimicrobium sp. LYQ92]|uniref:glycosyltransferase family 2 protein n=1 Tax=Serinicoccus sp. LYQ92 TaxID=3378798 RepID=UPI0038549C93